MLLLPSTITAQEAPDAQRMLAQVLQHEPETGVVVDAAGLRTFDTSALAVLLECRRLAQAWGKGFVVRNAPDKLQALARLYGVDVLLIEGAMPTAPGGG
ncbi:MAG: STAS domain-containing protein [Proteobacteria bacterium]|nr:STAS domain-containing protein [Pseudomonadota bacterium]